MFNKSDSIMALILMNIHQHLKDNYDYCLVVVADTGLGKSMFCLHLLETWNKLVLNKEIVPKDIRSVNTDFHKFLTRFKTMNAYDMNIFDEGVTGLDSKDHMKRLSKDITKLFNVFRSKRFFTVIVLPSFWGLNKYFRETRLRGLVWINKRGEYKFYTKEGIKWLNANNERRYMKSMELAYPFHWKSFPDYTGILKEPYDQMKNEGVDTVLQEVLQENQKKVSLVDVYKDQVVALVRQGKTHKQIRDQLGISGSTLTRCLVYAQEVVA
tara:strand:- start:278 stop:1081 length:804 start_codon:yes stop_codon:yes gene_type:complete